MLRRLLCILPALPRPSPVHTRCPQRQRPIISFDGADLDDNMTADESNPTDGSRLLIISNRLPLTIKRSDDGHYDFSMSSGGLVTGLSGLSKTMTYEWYGWPGLQVPEAEIDLMKDKLKKECDAHPVFVDDDLADKHYNGFSSMQPQVPIPC